ncbi:glycosyltransferase family 4 protein [Pseudofrankia sp. DC12]|uniref:glycosyltransferase family 4 protein n=1 Tax=Pseudofrankia sp. DC12 TaxID=683315 RepID=UPI0005F7DE3E|nr:glycosyltransferase family 4 protein [Pseudofrankia sp. DC12]
MRSLRSVSPWTGVSGSPDTRRPGASSPPGTGGSTGPSAAAPRVLLLAAPAGPGGGVDRYVSAVEEALLDGGATLTRLNHPPATDPGTGGQLAARVDFARRAAGTARRLGRLDALVAGRPDLVKPAASAASLSGARRVPVLCYGADIWRMPPADRALLTRHPLLCPVTISSFSAGALAGLGLARLLPPGVPSAWRTALLAEGARRRPHTPVPTVLSVFPLAAWADKGLGALVEALAVVRAELGPVRLVVAGHGPAPGALHELLSATPDAELHESPPDEALARLYATADLFALCTRTRPTGPRPCGEGYGLVLLEAQLAGCAVVGPAFGGSRDAYQEGVTGMTPVDESPGALADILVGLLRDRARLTRTGRRGAEWAESVTRPEDHRRAVFQVLLDRPPAPPDPAAPASGAAPSSGSTPPPPEPRPALDRPRTLPAASGGWPTRE